MIAQYVRAIPITNFIPLIDGAFDTNYKNDFVSNRCCQGKTEHLLSIPAAPERVLFVSRRLDFQRGYPILCDTCSIGQDFSRATAHTIDYWFFNKEKSLNRNVSSFLFIKCFIKSYKIKKTNRSKWR